MKKIIFILLVAFVFNAKAQTATGYVTGMMNTASIVKSGDIIYVLRQGFDVENAILTIDTTATTPTATDFITNVQGGTVYDCFMVGNNLYFSTLAGNIYVTDVTDATHNITLITSGVERCNLVVKDNFLYLSHYDQAKLSKVNLNDTFPATPTDIYSITYPASIAINGNDLYFSGGPYSGPTTIYKMDITQTTPNAIVVADNLTVITDIEFKVNEMYFVQRTGATGMKISKLDSTEAYPATITDVVLGVGDSGSIILDGNDIYIAEFFDGVYKFTENTAAIAEENLTNSNIYPNPATNFIQINNVAQNASFEIYNTLGKVISNGNYSDNSKIDVSNLSKGIYILKIKEGDKMITKKFIKK